MHAKMEVMYYIIGTMWLQAQVHLHVQNIKIAQFATVILKTYTDAHGAET